MATERQVLNRKRNWNIFLIKGVLDSMLRVRRFFIEQDDEAGCNKCDKCLTDTREVLKILKEYVI